MELDALRTFVKVAELASFTRAAEQLGMPKARVSTTVQQLETQLGTRLLHRTTRTVRLTPDGEAFLARCEALLGEAEELQTMFQQAPGAIDGRLRVDLPIAFARSAVIPRLPEFLARHPRVAIDLSTTDRRVDVVEDGFDCVLRVGALEDSGLVARGMGHLRMVNCASPAYLARHGTPRALDDLDHHLLVRYSQRLQANAPGWEYHDGDAWKVRDMPSVVTVNNTDAYRAVCLAGLGMIQVPLVGVAPHLADGSLVEVLPHLAAQPMPVSLVYANRRNLSKRVQALMDWLAEVLAPYLAAANQPAEAPAETPGARRRAVSSGRR